MTARVLVVEDDPPIASVLERGLELAGYEVEVVLDGPAGLSRWADGGWHVVVLDVMLPGMDGVAMCAARRADGDRTPVLLLTARDDERLRSGAGAAGADAFLTKPYAYADLLATLARLTGPEQGGREPGPSEGTAEPGQAAVVPERDR
jgi:two-component system response regulator MprA